MTFKDLISKRQSDRKYLPSPVEKEKIMQCLEAARLSPSACNGQPWSLILIDDALLVKEAAKHIAITGINKFAHEAPVFIAIILEKSALTSRIGSVIKDKEFSLLDIGILSAHFCLQAAELGLGTCMVGWFDEKRLKKLLNVPKNKRIPLVISLGYPNNKTREKSRKPINTILHNNYYR